VAACVSPSCFDRRRAYDGETETFLPTIKEQTMKRLHGFAASLAFGVAWWLAAGPGSAGGDNKEFLPPDVYKELVARETKILQEKLKGAPAGEQIARAKVAAVMLARFALDADKKAGETAGLERMALQVARLLANKDKIAEAQKLAASETVPGGTLEGFDAKPLIGDVMELMDHLRQKKKGGDGIHSDLQTSGPLKNLNGIEEKFRTLAKNKLKDAALNKSAKEMVLLGYRTAVLAEVVSDLAPAQKTKQWRELAAQMHKASMDLARASEKKDADGIFKAGTRLDAACSSCHSVFK
jgi:hypothetical protein